jgi:hypothetical protein
MMRGLVSWHYNLGYISIKNLRRVAKDLGEDIQEEELQQMLFRADLDRDDLVSEDEFYQFLTRKVTPNWSVILYANRNTYSSDIIFIC